MYTLSKIFIFSLFMSFANYAKPQYTLEFSVANTSVLINSIYVYFLKYVWQKICYKQHETLPFPIYIQ